jgi:hypothetical protein
MVVNNKYPWVRVDRYTGMNTREPADLIADTELTYVSNFTFDELGALKKIKQPSIMFEFSDGIESEILTIFEDKNRNHFWVVKLKTLSGYKVKLIPFLNPGATVDLREFIGNPSVSVSGNFLFSLSSEDPLMRHKYSFGNIVVSDEMIVPPFFPAQELKL